MCTCFLVLVDLADERGERKGREGKGKVRHDILYCTLMEESLHFEKIHRRFL